MICFWGDVTNILVTAVKASSNKGRATKQYEETCSSMTFFHNPSTPCCFVTQALVRNIWLAGGWVLPPPWIDLYLHGRDAGTCLGVVLREKLVLGLFSKQVRDFGLTACVREARGGNLCKWVLNYVKSPFKRIKMNLEMHKHSWQARPAVSRLHHHQKGCLKVLFNARWNYLFMFQLFPFGKPTLSNVFGS